MTITPTLYLESDLDGDDPGGFVVVNVEAPMTNPYQVIDDEQNGGAYFSTLRDARAACGRLRTEAGNDEIYVYALIGVRRALELHPDVFAFA